MSTFCHDCPYVVRILSWLLFSCPCFATIAHVLSIYYICLYAAHILPWMHLYFPNACFVHSYSYYCQFPTFLSFHNCQFILCTMLLVHVCLVETCHCPKNSNVVKKTLIWHYAFWSVTLCCADCLDNQNKIQIKFARCLSHNCKCIYWVDWEMTRVVKSFSMKYWTSLTKQSCNIWFIFHAQFSHCVGALIMVSFSFMNHSAIFNLWQ